jgi:hypothetical protein
MSEAKRAKAHKLLKNNDPTLNHFDYTASFIRFTNFLNVNYDDKQRMSWIKARYPKVKFSEAHPFEYRAMSTLIRALDNGNELSDEHIERLDSEVDRLTCTKKEVKVAVVSTEVVAAKPSIQDKMDEKVSMFLGEFAGLVDEYVTTKSVPKVDSLISGMGIRGPMIKKIVERIQGTKAELTEVLEGKDKQLVEGYSNFKKPELKKLLGMYENLEASLGQAKVLTVRKPRKTKVKPPAVIAKNVKFMKEQTELGLTSVNPALAVGASEVWAYNTKYRRLIVVKAVDGQTLTWKGTTLQNFNIEKSFSKTIRKPEEIKPLVGQGTRTFTKYINSLKAKPGKVNGRINEETVLLAIFK